MKYAIKLIGRFVVDPMTEKVREFSTSEAASQYAKLSGWPGANVVIVKQP